MRSSTPSSSFRNARRAFTLLEILVVLAIIGMLVGLSVGALGKIFENAKIDTAKTFVGTSLKIPLQAYRMDMGDYPTTTEGLAALVAAPAGNPNAAGWRGPYLESAALPQDPWKHPYQYAYPGTHTSTNSAASSTGGLLSGTGSTTTPTTGVVKPDIWSFGPDGADGTADDIGNWQ